VGLTLSFGRQFLVANYLEKLYPPLSPYPGLKSFAIAVKFGVAKSQSDFDLGEELAN